MENPLLATFSAKQKDLDEKNMEFWNKNLLASHQNLSDKKYI